MEGFETETEQIGGNKERNKAEMKWKWQMKAAYEWRKVGKEKGNG